MSSRWATTGATERRIDYQIWCGPAIGVFNRWVANSPLADPLTRTVDQIAENLMLGAAILLRVQHVRQSGVDLGLAPCRFVPRVVTDSAGIRRNAVNLAREG
jgi:hypothetical protein